MANFSCVRDEITDLPVCSADPSDVAILHELLGRVSDYLETHHLAPLTSSYHYRRNYLPEMVTGNDVVGLSRLAQEVQARGSEVPPELAVLLPQDDNERVTAEDVEYVADGLAKLRPVIEASDAWVREWDLAHGNRPFPWGFLLAVGILAGIGVAAAVSR